MLRVSPRALVAAAAGVIAYANFLPGKTDNVADRVVGLSFRGLSHCTAAATPPSLPEGVPMTNWSGTHSVNLRAVRYPEDQSQLEELVRTSHLTHSPLRPLGSALSPNGIGFAAPNSVNVSMSLMDKVLSVDAEGRTVTVQAGAKVSTVIEALRPHGLTLPNLASIAEQQVGGFVSVSAHGTGASIPPACDFVESFVLVTPALGPITLSRHDVNNKLLFNLCRVGLGCFGVVSSVTLRCIPAHRLREKTEVMTRKEATAALPRLLKAHKHVRYMWVPYEDCVVVVTSDPTSVEDGVPPAAVSAIESKEESRAAGLEATRPLRELLLSHPRNAVGSAAAAELGFAELRDHLLALDPLDAQHVKAVNKAEALFWSKSTGVRIAPSDKLLQFDCGGQQWVHESCFPCSPSPRDGSKNDLGSAFVLNLLEAIEVKGLAAPSPIEQRWTAASSATMSPAAGGGDDLFSWVGVIMYLPTDDPRQRRDISKAFVGEYCDIVREVGEPFGAITHWAKLELPEDEEELKRLQETLKKRFPVDTFNAVRSLVDPHNIMGNTLVDTVFGYSNNLVKK